MDFSTDRGFITYKWGHECLKISLQFLSTISERSKSFLFHPVYDFISVEVSFLHFLKFICKHKM